MIRVTVLGTSGASPTKTRSLTSVALSYDGNIFLFDCGEGTQMQVLKYGVNYSRIKAIFISHIHGDHVIGIAGLVRTMALNGRKNPLYVFVPRGEEKVISTLVHFDRAVITFDIVIKGIGAGVQYKGKDFTVSSFRLSHTVPSLGYAFKVNDRRRFNETKCKKLGLEGEMFSILQKKGSMRLGRKTVRIESVTTVKPGEKIVYASDTRPCASTVSAAKGANLLIHEATYADTESKLARERGHSTAKAAADIAKRAKVGKLVLIHMSARYRDSAPIEAEARSVFKDTIVAQDGEDIFI